MGRLDGARAVAAAAASKVSGEIGRSVLDVLGGTGKRDLVRGNRRWMVGALATVRDHRSLSRFAPNRILEVGGC